jgi:hypothetical protein
MQLVGATRWYSILKIRIGDQTRPAADPLPDDFPMPSSRPAMTVRTNLS